MADPSQEGGDKGGNDQVDTGLGDGLAKAVPTSEFGDGGPFDVGPATHCFQQELR